MMSRSVLLVGIAPHIEEAFEVSARTMGLMVSVSHGEIAQSGMHEIALVVVQTRGDEETAFQQVRQLTKLLGDKPIVVLAHELRASTVMRLCQLGIRGVIDLPGNPSDIVAQALQHASSEGPRQLGNSATNKSRSPILGESAAMQQIREQVTAAASTLSRVLIVGETGTGKGLVARALHEQSARADGPFIHVDCAALAPSVIESELFGHERGAFTGASERRIGRFETAERGTIFLDEIAELDPTLQAKLLRVLQDHTYERVGGSKTLRMTARVVAATNRDMTQSVRDKTFRQDLYYRLNVVNIKVSALRQRRCDVAVIARAGLEQIAEQIGVRAPEISPGYYERLEAYDWPGNVRELHNVLERCLVQLRVDQLEASDLDGILQEDIDTPHQTAAIDSEDPHTLRQVLQEVGGNISRASRRLGIPRSTLRYRIQQNGLTEFIPRD